MTACFFSGLKLGHNTREVAFIIAFSGLELLLSGYEVARLPTAQANRPYTRLSARQLARSSLCKLHANSRRHSESAGVSEFSQACNQSDSVALQCKYVLNGTRGFPVFFER